jgi:hypothetical protein
MAAGSLERVCNGAPREAALASDEGETKKGKTKHKEFGKRTKWQALQQDKISYIRTFGHFQAKHY